MPILPSSLTSGGRYGHYRGLSPSCAPGAAGLRDGRRGGADPWTRPTRPGAELGPPPPRPGRAASAQRLSPRRGRARGQRACAWAPACAWAVGGSRAWSGPRRWRTCLPRGNAGAARGAASALAGSTRLHSRRLAQTLPAAAGARGRQVRPCPDGKVAPRERISWGPSQRRRAGAGQVSQPGSRAGRAAASSPASRTEPSLLLESQAWHF